MLPVKVSSIGLSNVALVNELAALFFGLVRLTKFPLCLTTSWHHDPLPWQGTSWQACSGERPALRGPPQHSGLHRPTDQEGEGTGNPKSQEANCPQEGNKPYDHSRSALKPKAKHGNFEVCVATPSQMVHLTRCRF